MKFLVSKDIRSNPNFTLLLSFYSLFLLLYLVGDIIYIFNFFGVTPKEVLSTISGNVDEFIEPLTLLSLLEYLHVSLFLAIFSLFSVLAILLRLELKQKHKKMIIYISMFSLLLTNVSLLVCYFFFAGFVYPFIVFNLLWHSSAIYAVILILYQLFKK